MADSDILRLIEVFDRLADAGFVMGPQWLAAHQICQDHEGEQTHDWGHALCHRIEGDDWNAGYWYRNAGKPVATGTFAEEWSAIRMELVERR